MKHAARHAWGAALAASLLAAGACAPADQAEDAAAPDAAAEDNGAETDALTSPEITEADLRYRISTLADDSFEGRAPATPGGQAASQWIADEMARAGLEPAVGDSYFQPVSLLQITLDEATASASFSAGDETIDAAYPDDIVFWSRRTEETIEIEDSPLVFVGYGVNAPEYGWNDYEGLDVEGRTVVMLINDPGFAHPERDLFNGSAMTYYGRWTYKFEEAARQGATGAIIIHQTAPASYGWNVVSGSWTGSQLNLAREPGTGEFTAMESWITEDLGRQLFGAAGLDFDALTAAASEPGFEPVEMTGVTMDAVLNNSFSTLDSRNVAGLVRGTERPDEYVLYTAHWDHIGLRETEDGSDGLYNGAVDNATGTAAILEIGEAFAANPPERSVMILAVTAEESGLLGSAYYGENPIVPHAQTVAGVNIDAILPAGRTRDVVVVGYGASELEDILAEEAATQDRVIVPDPNPEAGYFYRSDHISIAKQGVPMIYADAGVDLLEGGIAAGTAFAEEYRANRYHGPADEYSEDWVMDGMVEDTTLFFQLGARLANSDAWPNWYEGNEFRALRDAQRPAD